MVLTWAGSTWCQWELTGSHWGDSQITSQVINYKKVGKGWPKKGPQTLDQRCYINLANEAIRKPRTHFHCPNERFCYANLKPRKGRANLGLMSELLLIMLGRGKRILEKIISVASLDFQKPFWNIIMHSQSSQFIYSMQIQHKVHNYIDSKVLENTCIVVLTSKEILDSGGILSWKPSFPLWKHGEVNMSERVEKNCLTAYKSTNTFYHTHLPQS